MPSTPQYGWRYQGLADPPDGAALGENLALDAESTVSSIDARLTTAETDINTAEANITTLTPIFVRKTADETVNNSAALQNDDELFAAVAANKTYVFEVTIWYSTGTTPDIKFAFTFPAGATLSWQGVGYSLAGGNVVDLTATAWRAASGTSWSISGGIDYPVTRLKGILRTAGTAGTLRLQWAQATANASNTIVKADSFLEMWLRG